MGFGTDKCLGICLGQLKVGCQESRPKEEHGIIGESAWKCQPVHHWRKENPGCGHLQEEDRKEKEKLIVFVATLCCIYP